MAGQLPPMSSGVDAQRQKCAKAAGNDSLTRQRVKDGLTRYNVSSVV